MLTQAVSGVVETLRGEEKKLSQQQVAASMTVHNLEADVLRVQGAIAALMGQIETKPRRARKESTPKDTSSKELSSKPIAKAKKTEFGLEEVVSLVEFTIRKNGRLTMPKLRVAMQTVAQEDGLDQEVISANLELALRKGPFRFNGAHWELKS